MFKKKNLIKMAIAVVIAVGILIFTMKPVKVKGYQVKQNNITAMANGVGTLDAKVKTTVSSKISDRINKILVDQGSIIIKGQILVKLDSEQKKMDVQIASTEVTVDKYDLQIAEAELADSKVQAKNSKIEYERYKYLFSKKAVSKTDYEATERDYQSDLTEINKCKSSVALAKANSHKSKEDLKLKKLYLADTVIKAPYDGIVMSRNMNEGDITAVGSAILDIVSTDVIWVSTAVDESQLANIKPGQTATIKFNSELGTVYTGKVARISKNVDVETREFTADVALDTLPVNWATGQKSEVRIDTTTKDDIISIPEKYILWKESKPGLFIANGSKAKWVFVTLGAINNTYVEVVSGLKAGDYVVIPATADTQLEDGSRISVQ